MLLDFFNMSLKSLRVFAVIVREKIGELISEATMRFDTHQIDEVLRDANFEHTNEEHV